MTSAGRPRSFSRDAAVDSAMMLFWQFGYEGTSLDDLKRAMGGKKGISSASFYAAFGSKEALYQEALSRYFDKHGGLIGMLRDKRWPPRDRLERALRASLSVQTDTSHPLGCMLTLSATIGSGLGAGARQVTAAGRSITRAALKECLEDGIEKKSLSGNADLQGLTALYDGLLLGISIQARDGVPFAALESAISCALSAWDASNA